MLCPELLRKIFNFIVGENKMKSSLLVGINHCRLGPYTDKYPSWPGQVSLFLLTPHQGLTLLSQTVLLFLLLQGRVAKSRSLWYFITDPVSTWWFVFVIQSEIDLWIIWVKTTNGDWFLNNSFLNLYGTRQGRERNRESDKVHQRGVQPGGLHRKRQSVEGQAVLHRWIIAE